jgi:peptidoglycan/xylan/chitin deacetylase (PgdA/CDA1 family)
MPAWEKIPTRSDPDYQFSAMDKIVTTSKGSNPLWRWTNRLRKPWGIRILYYHGLVEQVRDATLELDFHSLAQFREHVRELRRRRVLSVSEFAAEFGKLSANPSPAVLLTVDDGYANNLVMAEIFEDARLPWSLFPSTGFVGTDGTAWSQEIRLFVLHGQASQIRLLGRWWSLDGRSSRESASHRLVAAAKRLNASERREMMGRLREQFPPSEIERLLHEFPSSRMLSWGQVRQLAYAGVEIGSHGVEHEIHHARQDASVRQRELAESKAALETHLDQPCRYFAFPNGDFVPESAAEVEAAGYELGFTTRNRLVAAGANRFLLTRMAPPPREHDFVREFLWALPPSR